MVDMKRGSHYLVMPGTPRLARVNALLAGRYGAVDQNLPN